MTVIGVVGLPGSGKTEAATVARELGIPVVTMGDVIRDACRDRGLDPATDHGRVARALRREGGPAAVADASLPRIREALEGHEVVLVDGIRSGDEVDRFTDAFGDEFVLVRVDADYQVRAERVTARSRDDTGGTGEPLRERDERELGFGMGDAMARADITIQNNESLARFRDRVRSVIREHKRP